MFLEAPFFEIPMKLHWNFLKAPFRHTPNFLETLLKLSHRLVFFPTNPQTLFVGNSQSHRKSWRIWDICLKNLMNIVFKVHLKVYKLKSIDNCTKFTNIARVKVAVYPLYLTGNIADSTKVQRKPRKNTALVASALLDT